MIPDGGPLLHYNSVRERSDIELSKSRKVQLMSAGNIFPHVYK